MAGTYRQFGDAYLDFARKVKGIDTKGVDQELIRWLVLEGDVLNRMGDAYRDLAVAVLQFNGPGDVLEDQRMERLQGTSWTSSAPATTSSA